MKVLGLVLTLTLLAGCGSFTPMEELERQAFLTGDWSAVEKRERLLERRKARRGAICPDGQVAVCDKFAGESRCSCVNHEDFSRVLGIVGGR